MNEEIVARFGADTGPIDKAMKGLTSNVGNFAREIGGHLLAAFSLGGGIALLEKATSKVQAIKRMSESLGTSTNFVQDIMNVGLAAGISGESIEKMMDKFIKGLPAGSDVEEEFYQMSERLNQIQDPSERARIAIESFGKSGVQMVGILAQGSDAIKALASSFSKFSESDIKNLEEAKLAHEKFGNWLTIWSGRLLIGYKFLALNVWGGLTQNFSALKKMLEEGANAKPEAASRDAAMQAAEAAASKAASDQLSLDSIKKYKEHLDDIALKSDDVSHDEKMAILERQKAYEDHMITLETDEKKRYEMLTKVADIEGKITEEKKKQSEELKKITRDGERQFNSYWSLKKSEDKLSTSRSDFSKLSLEELAGMGDSRTAIQMGYGGIGGDSRPGISPLMLMARQAISERDAATQSTAWGDFSGASRHQQNYENLVKNNPALKEAVREPFKDLEEAVKEHTTKMEQLLDNTGIIVREVQGTD